MTDLSTPRLRHHRDCTVSSVAVLKEGGTEETWTRGSDVVRVLVSTADGVPVTDLYYRGGRLHRIGGPAEVLYHEGMKSFERWRRDGVVHRVDGPAETHYVVATGRTVSAYMVNGSLCDSAVDAARALYSYGPLTLRAEFVDSGYAPLLEEGFSPEQILEVVVDGVFTIEGIAEVLRGAPVEWVRSFEGGRAS